MLFSQETEYAIRIIDALKDEKQHKAEDICRTQKIPAVWIYKIAKKLQKAGFINIKLGCRGGYTLGKDLETYTLKDLVFAIEPSLCLRPCLNAPCPLQRDKGTCPLYRELLRLQSGLVELMSAGTMKDVLFREETPQDPV